MKTDREPENGHKWSSNVLVVIVSFLLLVSIAMSVIGLLNGQKDSIDGSEEESVKNPKARQGGADDNSLSDMFQKEFSESLVISGYDVDDPFVEFCAPVGGSGPVMSSFTICQPN